VQLNKNVRIQREGDSRDAPPDGQFATAETGRAVEGQDPAIHWMAATSTAMTQTGNSRLFFQQKWVLKHPLGGAGQVLRGLAEERASAVAHGAPQIFVAPRPAAGRIVRRADHVRRIAPLAAVGPLTMPRGPRDAKRPAEVIGNL
jgi:hypothetical protein